MFTAFRDMSHTVYRYRMASSMNFVEYLDWLLEDGPPTLPTVVQNILDEPIPEAVKKRLLKPLLPQPIPPPRSAR